MQRIMTYKEASDHEDHKKYPLQEDKIIWEDLNQNFISKARDYKDITDIAK